MSTWTREDMERAIQVEKILMPSARQKRSEKYNGEQFSQFVHYTSAESALSIIKHKELWLRNTTCMDDYREVEHGYELVHRFFQDQSNYNNFTNAFDAVRSGLGQQALTQFDTWWADIRYSSFIASLSDHQKIEDNYGRLSMWRGFGGAAARVAIVVKMPWFSATQAALRVAFNPVLYVSENDVSNELANVCSTVSANTSFMQTIDPNLLLGHVLNMLITMVTCSKHKGFHEEREWRLLYSPKIFASALLAQDTAVIKGVPQVFYKLPMNSGKFPILDGTDFSQIFEKLIIGPSPYPWAMYQAFVDALVCAGVSDAATRVFVSDIPIR